MVQVGLSGTVNGPAGGVGVLTLNEPVLLRLFEPQVASIKLEPFATPTARPPLVTVATAGLEELHVAVPVTFAVLPSLLVKMAVNCCCAPTISEDVDGVTASETGTAGLTNRVAEPLTEPKLAEMVVLPGEILVAYAGELIAATAGADEVQVAGCVMSCVEPSVNVAVAENCWLYPDAIEIDAGLTEIETTLAMPTVNVVEFEIELKAAEMVTLPCPALVASP